MATESTNNITDLSHDNRGVAKVNGKTTFITNALPGEQVSYKRVKKHRQFDEAVAVDVQHAAPQRVTAKCPHFTLCGGCSGQHIHHDYQIEHKQNLLLQHLQHFGQVTAEDILPPLLGPQWQYRHKARLAVRYVHKKEKVLVGFREANGRYVADINSCQVLHPAVGLKLSQLSDLIQQLSCFQQIPQIEVAISDEQTALIFRHLAPLTANDQELLINFAQEHEFIIYLQPKGPASIHKIWPENTPELLSYRLPRFDLNLWFHPSDFTQVNPEINRLMLDQAIALLAPQAQDTVLDLFCGLGNFTLPIATRAKFVTGVEGSDTMVQRATDNAARNHLTNLAFYATNLMEDWTQQPWAKQHYDKLLLDPPRSGAQAIVEQIEHLDPELIVYVSCNPATLARDAGILQQKAYRLLKAGIMDMFPHTSHVESIALFRKKSP